MPNDKNAATRIIITQIHTDTSGPLWWRFFSDSWHTGPGAKQVLLWKHKQVCIVCILFGIRRKEHCIRREHWPCLVKKYYTRKRKKKWKLKIKWNKNVTTFGPLAMQSIRWDKEYIGQFMRYRRYFRWYHRSNTPIEIQPIEKKATPKEFKHLAN